MSAHCLSDKLKPGMVLDQDVFDHQNILMLARGTVVTAEDIKVIKRLGLEQVKLKSGEAFEQEVPEKKFNKEDFKKFSQSYSKSTDEVAELIKFISKGNQLDIEQAHSIPQNLLKEVGSPYNLFSYLQQMDNVDDLTFGHSINVALVCNVIASWLGLDAATTRDVTMAGLLHDAGKSKIPNSILQKPGHLTDGEWQEIRKHPVYGYRILERAGAPGIARIGALMHHEREDGAGYPNGMDGGEIPLVAKVVAVADVYDAMTTNRPYRKKINPFQVIEQFQQGFYGILDVKILVTFLSRIAECYIGEMVQLSDGRTGQVVFINPNNPARPLIQTNSGFIDLTRTREVVINDI